MSRFLGRNIYIEYVDLMWQVTLMAVYSSYRVGGSSAVFLNFAKTEPTL